MPHKRAKKSARDADRLTKGQNNPPPKPSSDSHFNSLPKNAMRILNAAKIQSDYNAKKRARKQLENGSVPPGQESEPPKSSRGKGKQKAQVQKVEDQKEELKIRPGEKVGDFNRRIDKLMAPEINSAMRKESKSSQKSKSKKRKTGAGSGSDSEDESESLRKARAEEAKQVSESQPSSKDLKSIRDGLQSSSSPSEEIEKDFQKSNQRRRINDIVTAPPNLTKTPRGQSKESLLRKSKLIASMKGEDPEKVTLDRGKARLPDPIKKKEEISLSRQNLLNEEREKAIKAYRVRKEMGIQEREAKRER